MAEGLKRGNPAMTTISLTAARKGDPQDVEGKIQGGSNSKGVKIQGGSGEQL